MKPWTMILLSAMGVTIAGCAKQDHTGTPSDADRIREFFAQNRADATQYMSLNASTGGELVGMEGTHLIVSPDAFTDALGNTVTGPVQVHLIEVLEPGDMVRLNMQTVGLELGSKHVLKSGGELFLQALQDNQPLGIVPGAAQIAIPTDDPDPTMALFEGTEDAEGDLLWEKVDSADVEAVADSGCYYVDWPPFSFINMDNFPSFADPTTDITVHYPEGFGAWGITVFLVVPELNCMVFFEAYDDANTTRAGFGVPIGLQGTIVAAGYLGEQFYASFTPTTIVSGHEESIDIQPMTVEEFDTMCADL